MDDLIVEDGTGLANADAYIDVAFADTYHLNRNNAAWASASADEKLAAIRDATRYIDSAYCFAGWVRNIHDPQSLQFPRYGLVFNYKPLDRIWPLGRLQQATAEAAARALVGELIVDTADQLEESVTVGPISVKYKNSTQSGQQKFQIIDSLLEPFVTNKKIGSGQIRLQRGG